jgi:hypothetical protein
MKQSKSRSHILIIIIIIICTACIMGCLGILALNVAAPTMSLTAHVCVGLTTTPKWQVGMSWALPISSYAPSLAFSPYAVCTDVPDAWLNIFTSKMAGELMFPP